MIFAGATERALAAARSAMFVLWLIVVVPDPLGFYASLPDATRRPLGVFRLLPDALFTAAGLDALKWLIVVLCLLCIVRTHRPVAVVAAALLTVQQAIVREYAFINHEELALLLVTWALVVGREPVATLRCATVLLLVPYCMIAAHRLAFAAPAVFRGDSLPYWFASLHSLDRDGWGAGIWLLGHPELVTVMKVGFAITTVFELLGPLVLIAPRFRVVWVVVVVGFHVVNWFTLNLWFWENALLVLLLPGRGAETLARVKRRAVGPMTP